MPGESIGTGVSEVFPYAHQGRGADRVRICADALAAANRVRNSLGPALQRDEDTWRSAERCAAMAWRITIGAYLVCVCRRLSRSPWLR